MGVITVVRWEKNGTLGTPTQAAEGGDAAGLGTF